MSEKDKIKISRNLKSLRKLKRLTQQQLADELEIQRSSIGAYEEGRATPKYETLERISTFFEVSMDMLIKEDLSSFSLEDLQNQNRRGPDFKGEHLRILPITVDQDGRENIEFVAQKASAGYLNGFADPEYITDLPRFQLPMVGSGGTYRAFEIKGDSMLPLKSGTVIIGEYVGDWRDIKDGESYVLVSGSEGVVYKRIYSKVDHKGEGELTLRSDNPVYEPYTVPVSEVREVWKAKMYMSAEFPQPDFSIEKLSSMVMNLQQEIIKLKGDKED